MLFFLACQAIPVDSGVYFSGETVTTDDADTDDGFCPDTLPEGGRRYDGTVSQQRDGELHCEGSASLVWSGDGTIGFHALCAGDKRVCLVAEGTAGDSGAITAAITATYHDGPTSDPYDLTGTIDDISAALSWTYDLKDPDDQRLTFSGEAALLP